VTAAETAKGQRFGMGGNAATERTRAETR
jgi:hypothetical protein